MFSLNRVQVIGYQTQPLSVRQTPQGTSVLDLNLVVPYTFAAESGEKLSGKSFHTVTLWGPLAQVAGQFVKAGSQIFISGRLQTESWEDQQSGEKRNKTKIVGLDMILLDPKDGQLPEPQGAPTIGGALMNRADIIGNVTRDPEMRTTTNGQKVLTLGVATNDRWKDKSSGENRERTEFHNVVVWGDLAEEVSRSVRKGNRVHIAGRVQTRSFETQAGAKRYTTEIIADTFSLLGARNSSVLDAIDASGGSIPAQNQEQSYDVPSVESAPVAAGNSVPEVNYEPEVKVEDLPF